MIQWDLSKNVIWTRSFLIHLAPFLFHMLDINANQGNIIVIITVVIIIIITIIIDKLISIYKAKSKNTIILWSIIAYALFGLIYSLIYPVTSSLTSSNIIIINIYITNIYYIIHKLN